jgi:hypothetical protein
MPTPHRKVAMTRAEAEGIVGERFCWLDDSQRPSLLCPHQVRMPSAIYTPLELAAIARLAPIYGKEPVVCTQCEEEADAAREEEDEDEEEEEDEEPEDLPPPTRTRQKGRR